MINTYTGLPPRVNNDLFLYKKIVFFLFKVNFFLKIRFHRNELLYDDTCSLTNRLNL